MTVRCEVCTCAAGYIKGHSLATKRVGTSLTHVSKGHKSTSSDPWMVPGLRLVFSVTVRTGL